MLHNTLRSGSSTIHPRSSRPRARRSDRRTFALANWERLESRELLATIVWKSTVASGAWGNAANWVGGIVPGDGDSARINDPGITVSIADGQSYAVGDIQFAVAGSTLSLSSGTLDVTSTSTASNLKTYTQSGGTLTGAATVKLGGAATWTGGTMSGSGTTVADGGLTIGTSAANSSYSVTLDERTFVNNAAAALVQATGGSGYGTFLYLASGATFRNSTTGSFDFKGDYTSLQPGGNPYGGSFLNEGALTKSAGSSSTYTSGFASAITFDDLGAATVSVAAGTLAFHGGGTFSSSSPVQLAAGTTLDFAAGSFAISSAISAHPTATVRFSGGTVDMSGAYGVPGATVVSGGTVNLSTPYGSSASLTISGGAFNYSGPDMTTGTLVQSGGTFNSPSKLTVSGAITWTGGTMSGTGSTVANGGLTIGTSAANSSYSVTLDERTFVNNAAAALVQATGGSGYGTFLYLASGATFRNSTTGSFDFKGDYTSLQPGGNPYGGSFLNEGALTKSAGSSSTYTSGFASAITFDDLGAATVSVAAGTLAFHGGGTFSSSSPVQLAAGTTLDFAAGSFAISSAISAHPNATVRFSGGTVDMSGAYGVPGATIISGGTFDYSGPDATLGLLTQSGGTLTGPSKLTVSGPITWTGGTMSGTGTTVADGGLTIGTNAANSSYGVILDTRTLVNNAAAALVQATGGSGYGTFLYLGSGATFRNSTTGSFDFKGDYTSLQPAGNPFGGTFLNEGALTKSAGSSTTYTSGFANSISLTNSGSVDLQTTGILRIDGPFTNLSGTTLSGGTYKLKGTLVVPGATTTIATLAAGLTLDGTAAQVLNGNAQNALAPLTTITSAGALTLLNGKTLTTSNTAFTNAGVMKVGTGSTFTATHSYTQSGGSTDVAGGMLISTTRSATINGGVLAGSGAGKVQGNVINAAGHVQPGGTGAAGSFTIEGNYTEQTLASLDAEIGGTAAGSSYDQLVVTGTATLGGTMNASVLGGYSPAIGDAFRILAAGTRTGTFAGLNGLDLGGGKKLLPVYNPADFTLSTVASSVTIDLTPSIASPTYGDSLTFTALVSPATSGSPTPTGTITFSIDGSAFGSPVTLTPGGGNSSATSLATSTLSAGVHTILASYSGDSNFAATSSSVSVTVAKAHLTITPDNKTRGLGQANPALTASLSGFVNGETLATSGVTGSPSLTTTATTASPAGNYPITVAGIGSLAAANYDFPASLFGQGTLTVTPGTVSGVSVGSTLSPSTYGQSIAFVVTVTGGGPTPSGTIQFLVDGVNFGSPVTLANGLATSSYSSGLGAGAHVITANYSGDGSYAASSGTFTQSVAKAHLTIDPDDQTRLVGQSNPALTATLVGFVNGETLATSGVTGSPTLATTATIGSPVGTYPITVTDIGTLAATNYDFPASQFSQGTLTVTTGATAGVAVGSTLSPSTYGDSVSFTVIVTGGGPTPIGTVQFLVDGANFGSPVALVNGSATSLATSSLGAGGHTITAAYSGDGNYDDGTDSFSQVVNKAHLTITPDDKSRPVGTGNPALTATLTGFVNGETLATSGVTGGPSLSTTATAASPAGTYPITVAGLGTLASANYDFPAALFGQGTLTVTSATTAFVSVGSTLSPSTYGDSVSFTVLVTGGGPTPTGTVQFLVDGANLGSPVALINGAATSIATTAIGVGNHSITATYSGDSSYPEAGGSFFQVVEKAHLAIIPESKSRLVGQANPTLTAILSGFVNGENLATSGVTGAPTLTTTATAASPVGSYPITVTGIGTLAAANYDFPAALFGQGTLTVTAGAAATLAVGSTLAPSTYGDAVSFTVIVTGGGPTPTGTVQFLVDGTNFGLPVTLVNGAAVSLATTALGAGSHAVAATYSGDGNYATGGSSLTQMVNKAALTVVADDASMNRYDALPTLGYHLTGFVNGENSTTAGVVADVALSTAATSSSPAGYYAISPTVASLSAANYELGGVQDGTLTVRPKVMDVRVVYGTSGNHSMSILGLTRNLPFLNIRALDVIFSDDVDVSSSMMGLSGVNTPGYSFSGFGYSSGDRTATWTLSSPLTVDRLSLLVDGPAAPPVVGSGPNIAAGPFRTGFNVLPGDVNGDGAVTIADALVVRNNFTSLGGSYLVWADLNGDGVIDILDLNESRKRIGNTLPR